MTDDQRTELLDLYIDDELPDALRAHVEAYLAAHPDAEREVQELRATVSRLHAAPAERPDAWFVERTLDGLLHENAAQTPAVLSRTSNT
jgi:anti-sigma factor RsiW